MTLPRSPTFLPFQNDCHPADIIAALRKKALHWLLYPVSQD
ncbi:hypothetical protein [Buttiauxella agrestis]|uniref:Uncharacterized protein n=1 Tax=Buttiauxella agrestis ATCC 33320 TaxID=1006004 RepID=A0A085GBF2_9ENTR|nr:hypothetical protein GBAG_2545 [Buttiauxella agrestis ATCC 33320]